MKSNLFRVSVIAVLAACAGCAQNVNSVHATVPFNFVVNGRNVPAGYLTVERSFVSGALILRTDGRAGAHVLTTALNSHTAPGKARLVLHRYGITYFLAEVWDPENYGRTLPQSSREREYSAKDSPETKTVALSLQ